MQVLRNFFFARPFNTVDNKMIYKENLVHAGTDNALLITCPHVLQMFLGCDESETFRRVCDLFCELAKYDYIDWWNPETEANRIKTELSDAIRPYGVELYRPIERFLVGALLVRVNQENKEGVESDDKIGNENTTDGVAKFSDDLALVPIPGLHVVTMVFFVFCNKMDEIPEQYQQLSKLEKLYGVVTNNCDECYVQEDS